MTSRQTEPLLNESVEVRAVIQHVQLDMPSQFIDVRMEDLVHEANTG